MSESEDKYHETVIDIEARAKNNEDVVLKMGNSLHGIFMLGPKPMSFYDLKVKHGLGYTNPYTLKKEISHNPILYDASGLVDSKIQMNFDCELFLVLGDHRIKIHFSRIMSYPKLKIHQSDRANKMSDVASKNDDSNKKIVINDDIKNALIAKNVLCVSCAKNVLIPCHDTCLAKYKLKLHLKVSRALFTTSRTIKSKFEDPSSIVSKTRFSVKTVQSKSLDTTPVVSKTKIDAVTPLSAKHKVSSAFKLQDRSLSNYMKNKILTSQMWQKRYELQPMLVVQIILWIVDSGCSKHMTGDRSQLKFFIEKFMGTISFRNDHFAAITCYGDYVHGNITVCHVYYVEGLRHNLLNVEQLCDGDLEVAFRSKTCYVRNLEGDDLLTGDHESNLCIISIFDMAASSPVCLMSKATSTKSWLWHRRISHLNFGTINDLTKHYLCYFLGI
ncbi:hypothetical protein Tco_0365630 [Tanacetum coccineum]